jgi:hypothetical protein
LQLYGTVWRNALVLRKWLNRHQWGLFLTLRLMSFFVEVYFKISTLKKKNWGHWVTMFKLTFLHLNFLWFYGAGFSFVSQCEYTTSNECK